MKNILKPLVILNDRKFKSIYSNNPLNLACLSY